GGARGRVDTVPCLRYDRAAEDLRRLTMRPFALLAAFVLAPAAHSAPDVSMSLRLQGALDELSGARPDAGSLPPPPAPPVQPASDPQRLLGLLSSPDTEVRQRAAHDLKFYASDPRVKDALMA